MREAMAEMVGQITPPDNRATAVGGMRPPRGLHPPDRQRLNRCASGQAARGRPIRRSQRVCETMPAHRVLCSW